MNKVTTINLGGNAYQLEEAGYDKLRAYLSDATAKLGSNPDTAEIIGDLERAIAEKCDTYLTAGKTVVTETEVSQIIKDMGPVHVADGGVEGEPSSETRAADPTKHFYRVREGAVLFGICNGIAAYFGGNVVLIRILFVVFALATHGLLLLAYLIAALIIPTADTPEKRAAAHGIQFSAQDFIDRAQDLGNEFKATSKEWKRYRRAMRREYRGHWPATGSPVVGLLIALLSIAWILSLLSLVATHSILGVALPVGVPLWQAIVALAIIYSVLMAPLRHLGYGVPAGAPRPGFWSSPLRLIVEVGVLWFILWMLYTHVPTVHAFFDMAWTTLQQSKFLR